MKKILLVEDDVQIANLLNLHFQDPLYSLTSCRNGVEALSKINASSYHLFILDIMLPDMNGIDVCRRIRQQHNQTPIMMLSSLSEENDKVLALEIGADDYVTKPFSVFELVARTKALLRREDRRSDNKWSRPSDIPTDQGELPDILRFGDLTIEQGKRKVVLRGKRLDLTPKEFELLSLLAARPGKTFSRHELLELIWGFAFQEYEHTVTAHINRLRIKLEKDLNKPEYILTSWGTGYRFAE